MHSRRDALRVLAASAMVPALTAETAPAKNLSPEDLQMLTRLVDLIIPRTDTPGAADAGVPLYIDRAIGHGATLGPRIHAGLARLRDAHFFTAGADEQIAQLKALEAQADPFFQLIKNLTIDGYYSSKEGLVQELGYHGNTYVEHFVGCTHPEHGPGSTDAN
jgi:hypothetical protein